MDKMAFVGNPLSLTVGLLIRVPKASAQVELFFRLLTFQLNPHRDGRALSWRRLNRMRAAQDPRALRDALQAQPDVRAALGREATSVVADCERRLPGVNAKPDLRLGRTGMFEDV